MESDATDTESPKVAMPPSLSESFHSAISSISAASESAAATDESQHPLEHRWTLWYDPGDNSRGKNDKTWGQTLSAVYSFQTVENFWWLHFSLFNNLRQPSTFPAPIDFNLFKDGIQPSWEDASCVNGGAWILTITKDKQMLATLDELWLNAAMICIGEQMEDGEQICGVVASIRRNQCRISLWTRDGPNEAVQMKLAREFRDLLQMRSLLIYRLHVCPINMQLRLERHWPSKPSACHVILQAAP